MVRAKEAGNELVLDKLTEKKDNTEKDILMKPVRDVAETAGTLVLMVCEQLS